MRVRSEGAWWIFALTVVIGMFGAIGSKADPLGFLLGPASPLMIEIGFSVVGVVYAIWGVLILIGRGWEPQQAFRSDFPLKVKTDDTQDTLVMPVAPVIPIRKDESA